MQEEKNPQKIIEKKDELIEIISLQGSEKKFNDLLEKAKISLQKSLFKSFLVIKQQIINFASENIYNQKIYLLRKKQLNEINKQFDLLQQQKSPDSS